MQCGTSVAQSSILSDIPSDKVDEDLKRDLLLRGSSDFLIISNDLNRTYSAVGLNSVRVFKDFDMILATGDLPLIYKLVNEPSVIKIVPNFRVKVQMNNEFKVLSLGDDESKESLYSWGRSRVGSKIVDKLYNVSGSGVVVAVLDTGISLDHDELIGKLITINPLDHTYPGGWIEFDRKGIPICSAPRDTHFHGTWVSSIIAGEFIGIASKVKLMHGLILHGGEGTAAQLLSGLEWVLEPYTCNGVKTHVKPNVVSLSLGVSGNYSDVLLKPILRLIQKNIIVVAAIGNDGPGTSSNPGNIWGVIGVGALNRNDEVADFSSSEVVDWPSPPGEWLFKDSYPKNYIKPDYISPGVLIPGAYVKRGYYLIASGTSASAPIVSGVVALVIEALRNTGKEPTVNEVYDILNRSADKLCNISRCGWGIVNAVKAVAQALDINLNELDIDVNSTRVQVLETISLTSKYNLNYFFDDLKLGVGRELITTVPIADMGYHFIHAVGERTYGYKKIYLEPKIIIKNRTVIRGEWLELILLGFPGASDVLIYLGSNLLTYQPLNLLGYSLMRLLLPYINPGDYEVLIVNLEGPITIEEKIYVREEIPKNISFKLVALSPSSHHINSTVDVYVISLVDGKIQDPTKLYHRFINGQPTASGISKISDGVYKLTYVATSPGIYKVLFIAEVEVNGEVLKATATALTDVTKPYVSDMSEIINTWIELRNLTYNLERVNYEINKLKSDLNDLNSTLTQLRNNSLYALLNEVLMIRVVLLPVVLILVILNLIIIKGLKRRY
ncbi:MAG: S8 family serine peptidase [Sulfolobales archaeon]|nr:S8 family serine peptidase [Sulfolobales archaeon]MDW7969797.1 S8 family serine peptidase [Sulfolobales archaeon]